MLDKLVESLVKLFFPVWIVIYGVREMIRKIRKK